MNQDELLERAWRDVINVVGRDLELDAKRPVRKLDFAHVARFARYEAVFGFCSAFDERDEPLAKWLACPPTHRRWKLAPAYTAAGIKASAADSGDEPFADSTKALARLLRAGVSADALATLMYSEAHSALAGVRTLLTELAEANPKLDPDELAGLHESLLTADPSGNEARPGSWPPVRGSKKVAREALEPILCVRKSFDLAFSPDASRVVAATGGAITEISTGREVTKCALLPNTASISWSADGRFIAGASTSGKIAIFDPRTGKRLRVLEQETEGRAPVFSADGRVLFGGDWDGNLFAWDVKSGRELARHSIPGGMVSALMLAPGDAVVAVVTQKGSLVEELVTFRPLLEGPKRRRIDGVHMVDCAIHPRGGRALVGTFTGVAWLDLQTGKLSKRRALAKVRRVAFSPDGSLAVLTRDSGFRIGPSDDLSLGTVLEREYPSAVSFSPDGKRVALATWRAGEVWDVATLLRR